MEGLWLKGSHGWWWKQEKATGLIGSCGYEAIYSQKRALLITASRNVRRKKKNECQKNRFKKLSWKRRRVSWLPLPERHIIIGEKCNDFQLLKGGRARRFEATSVLPNPAQKINWNGLQNKLEFCSCVHWKTLFACMKWREIAQMNVIHETILKYSRTSLHWNAFTAVRCEKWDHHLQANQPLLQSEHANKSLQGWIVEQNAICKKAFTIKGRDSSFRCGSPCWHVTCWCWMGCVNVRGPPLAFPRLGSDQHEQLWAAEVGHTFGSLQADRGASRRFGAARTSAIHYHAHRWLEISLTGRRNWADHNFRFKKDSFFSSVVAIFDLVRNYSWRREENLNKKQQSGNSCSVPKCWSANVSCPHCRLCQTDDQSRSHCASREPFSSFQCALTSPDE